MIKRTLIINETHEKMLKLFLAYRLIAQTSGFAPSIWFLVFGFSHKGGGLFDPPLSVGSLVVPRYLITVSALVSSSSSLLHHSMLSFLLLHLALLWIPHVWSAKHAHSKLFQKACSLLPIAPLLFNSYPSDASPPGKLEYQPALQGLDYGKPRTYYPDYIQKDSGLQYKIVKEGNGYAANLHDE